MYLYVCVCVCHFLKKPMKHYTTKCRQHSGTVHHALRSDENLVQLLKDFTLEIRLTFAHEYPSPLKDRIRLKSSKANETVTKRSVIKLLLDISKCGPSTDTNTRTHLLNYSQCAIAPALLQYTKFHWIQNRLSFYFVLRKIGWENEWYWKTICFTLII